VIAGLPEAGKLSGHASVDDLLGDAAEGAL
jgi:hypothetical protein